MRKKILVAAWISLLLSSCDGCDPHENDRCVEWETYNEGVNAPMWVATGSIAMGVAAAEDRKRCVRWEPKIEVEYE